MKHILVLNDEAHHCYREKVGADDEEELKGDDRQEAEKNKEAARLWISGVEAVNRKLGVSRVIDLSATPFFLRGSGYAEGTLFPWTMSDFSLMDAIECALRGNRVGFHSIRINAQWRLVFRWTDAGPAHVAIVDYH